MNISKADRILSRKSWRINLVERIEESKNASLTSINELSQREKYSLLLRYKIDGVKPKFFDRLDYKTLTKKIAENLIAPSHLLMEIFVAPYSERNIRRNI